MERYHKNEILLRSLTRINQGAQSGIFTEHHHYCPHCKCYRFDPLLNESEAGAYVNFTGGTMAAYRSTGRYNLETVKFDHAVRYHLSTMNKFADRRIRL